MDVLLAGENIPPLSIAPEWRQRPAKTIGLSLSWFTLLGFGWEMINNSEYAVAEILFSVATCVFFYQIYSSGASWKAKGAAIIFGIVVFGGSVADGWKIKGNKPWSNLLLTTDSSSSAPRQAAIVAGPTDTARKRAPSLKHMFEDDFPKLPSYYGIITFNGQPMNAAWRLIWNYVEGSRFLMVYIDPALSVNDAVNTSQFVAASYRGIISHVDQRIDLSMKSPEDSFGAHFKDSPLSQAVFIYYDNIEFSSANMATIEAAFHNVGLSVHWRGMEYFRDHVNDEDSPPSATFGPDTVIFPDAQGTAGHQFRLEAIGGAVNQVTRNNARFITRVD